jgi:diketogulonate reductase-like aldo/keto reductase
MSTASVRTTTLPSGEAIPVLGQGTRHFAEDLARRADEISALRLGLDLGLRLIDTAELYADGGAEELVAAAIAGRRDEVFLVSKVLPWNATRDGTISACERSLARLGTDRLDLYLLNWRGPHPLAGTLEAFGMLAHAGKIRYWGVSNFDVASMTSLVGQPGGAAVATDEVLYNCAHRGIEYDLLPWRGEHRLPVIAYSPLDQGRLLSHPRLRELAARHDATPAQVALAWVLRQEALVAIPRAGRPEHVSQNSAALGLVLTEADLEALDEAFPPPAEPRPLEMF